MHESFPSEWVVGAASAGLLFLLLAVVRRARANVLIAAAATCAAFAIAEIGAWRWFVNQPPPPRWVGTGDPAAPAGVKLHPGILPTKARIPAKPADRSRVLFIGDSFTEGLGVASDANFAAVVGKTLGVDAVNHGVTGTDTVEQHLLWRDYSHSWGPDIVVWTFVLNDFFPQIPAGPDYLMRYEAGPLAGSYLLGMLRVVTARRIVQSRTIEAYQRSLDPASDPEWFGHLDHALREVRDDMAARGGRLVFVIFPLLWDLQDYPFEDAHAQVAAAAARVGVEVIDLLPVFRGEVAEQLWVSKFDHHPNQRGHAMAADRIAAVLRTGPLPIGPAPPPPSPEQWLNAAQALHSDPNAPGQALRVAITIAAAAARLAEIEGGPDSTAFAARALDAARTWHNEMEARWRPKPPAR